MFEVCLFLVVVRVKVFLSFYQCLFSAWVEKTEGWPCRLRASGHL